MRSRRSGRREKAEQLFEETLRTSTLSEIQYNYACFLAAEGREAEARELADRILRKKATMPDYIRRRERPWFRKAALSQATTARRMTQPHSHSQAGGVSHAAGLNFSARPASCELI